MTKWDLSPEWKDGSIHTHTHTKKIMSHHSHKIKVGKSMTISTDTEKPFEKIHTHS